MLVNFSKPLFPIYNGTITVDVLPILVLDDEYKELISLGHIGSIQ